MRPDWDETWMAVADVIAKRSRCARDKVGAVIVDVQNRVVATGYNGPTDPRSYHDCPSVHAELNAIAYVNRLQADGGTLYVSSNCCFDCAKVVANSGILRVVMREGRGYRDTAGVRRLFMDCAVEVTVL
jgi:dCMP deaminase